PGRVDPLADQAERLVGADDDLARGGADGCVHGYTATLARLVAISSLARRTAVDASAAYPSAPTASAYSWVTGAPPTMTLPWSRRPCFASTLMLALNMGIVVVRNAEKPTMSGRCSLIASANFSGATCTPRSMTWKPAPSNMML